MFSRLQALWFSVISRAERFVASRVVLVADSAQSLGGSAPPPWSLIEIVGREHYLERHRSIPIVRWLDARAVAKLESAAKPGTLFHIGPMLEGNRRLTFYEPVEAKWPLGRSIFRLPETLVISMALPPNALARVSRSSTTFFLSFNGESYRSGGLLAEPDRVAHAMGLKNGWHLESIDDERPWLLRGLRRLPLSAWLLAFSPAAASWLRGARGPLLSGVVAAVALNLLLALGYLTATQYWREQSLKALGPEVGALLDAQREVDLLAEQRRIYAGVLRDRQPIYPLWGALEAVWKTGGWISAVRVSDSVLTLRGRALSATEVLTALTKYSGFSDPTFAAAIRQEGGMQEFVIEARLSSSEQQP